MDTNESQEFREQLSFFRRIRKILRGRGSQVPGSFPLDEDWQRLRARIEADEVSRPVRSIRMRMFRYAAAAVFALCVLTGAVLWLVRKPGEADMAKGAGQGQPAKPAIANLPPVKGVHLILGDGRSIAVDSQQSITDKNGVAIQLDNQELKYAAAQGSRVAGGSKAVQKPDSMASAITYNTIDVPKGHKYKATLPDGTKIWINAASRIKYPTVFKGPLREVNIQGEAYLDVAKDNEHPFVVHAGTTNITVLGTAFNVNAYDPAPVTTLETGKVRVDLNVSIVTLSPGEQARAGQSGELKKTKVDTKEFTAWKDGAIYLGNASFAQVAQMLSREFDYDLEFEDSSLENLHFTIDMSAPRDLQTVLDHISSTVGGVKFEVTGRVVKIRK